MNIDLDRLQAFEDQLNPAAPEQGTEPVKILGYGEISAVFRIESMPDVAFKRLPPFPNPEERAAYQQVIEAYIQTLRDRLDVAVIESQCIAIDNRDGEHILYVAQPILPSASIGNQFLRQASETAFERFFRELLANLLRIWRKNASDGPGELIGIDAQVSNWAVQGENGRIDRLLYFDITTPFLRHHGREKLNPEIFLKAVPSFLVWLVRWAFLQDVLDRYYDLRAVLMDCLANLYKEKMPERLPAGLRIVNDVLRTEAAELGIEPIGEDEVRKYYKEDALIWTIFLNFRRLDRFLKTRLLGQKYQFILPGPIER
ncbi:MAG: DUF6206 family protein [candidate division KSB1 bacterium]|nr:DUF6206 family protein [candidate division KSB1 bacterium]